MIYLFYDKNNKLKQKSRQISASEKKKKRKRMQTHTNRQNTSYARRQALSLEMNADILVAILISVLRELKFRALKTD